MSDTDIGGGESFRVDIRMYNFLEDKTVQEFVLLDVLGIYYYFWPSWQETVDFRDVYLPVGTANVETIFDFTWPTGVGSFDNLRFWAAMVDPVTGGLFGDYDMVPWSYH